MTNSIAYGATRVINYPEDKFAGLPRSMDEWQARNVPDMRGAWAQIRELATQGNPLAGVFVRIEAATKAKKIADAGGAEVPAWARETLSFLDEYQDAETENLDEALAALSRAIA
jgi:hypothetical protein